MTAMLVGDELCTYITELLELSKKKKRNKKEERREEVGWLVDLIDNLSR